MSVLRKSRSDSRLANLPESQAERLSGWLLSGVSYHQAKEALKKEFGVKTSAAALAKFWESYCGPVCLARRSRSITLSDQIAQAVEKRPGSLDAALLDQIKQAAFEVMIQPGVKAGDVVKLTSLFLEARNQDIKKDQVKLQERRIHLLEKQAKQAKETIHNEKLTPEQKAARMREIFGAA